MMDYSLITHRLPENIAVNGRTYKLDTRTMKALQAYAVMAEDDETIPEEVKLSKVIALMLDAPSSFLLARNPEDTAKVYAKIADFLNGWPEEPRKPGKHKAEEIFSYSEDHALIVAAFRQAYGVSLEELREMHWWEFRALIAGIPEGTTLSRIMSIRSMEIDPKEPPKIKTAKREAKEAAALKRKGGRAKTGEEILSDAFAGL